MKKIIAISVMFVLLTGAVFAVDLGGTVIGTATILQSDNGDDSKVTSDFKMNRKRLEGAGENDDGTFGGWLRTDGGDFAGYAWWKPIDQLKLIIGGQPDGFWGKEGVTGWMFYQSAYDSDVVIGGNVWGWGPAGDFFGIGGGNVNMYGHPAKFRNAFYGGQGADALMLEVTPAEMVQINVSLPFDQYSGDEAADVFQFATVQVDLKFDFGNIALTYEGGIAREASGDKKGFDSPGSLYLYYGGSFGDISIDFGFGYHMDYVGSVKQPIWVGAGVKYSSDSFGIKARLLGGISTDEVSLYGKTTLFLADVLPYFVLSDTMRVFVSAGLGMIMPDEGDSWTDFHFNPYIEVGQEWGPKFLAGIKVWSDFNGDKDLGGLMHWAVPVALIVSF